MGAVDILRLRPAFTDEQAEALARLIDDNLATKRDIEALRFELSAQIEKTRADLELSIERLRTENERMYQGLLKWFAGFAVAIVGVLFTLLRLFG